jgi:hypothetical protein
LTLAPGLLQQVAHRAALLVEQGDHDVHRLDVHLVIAAQGQALGVGRAIWNLLVSLSIRMAGPSQAMSPSPPPSASTVVSRTPAERPRHPAWATPTRSPRSWQNSTGRQSAVITAHTAPGPKATAASASAPGPLRAASTTVVLCTCLSQTGVAGSESARARASRLAATAAGSSPT